MTEKKENIKTERFNNLNTVMLTISVTWPSFCMILRIDLRATIWSGVELLGMRKIVFGFRVDGQRADPWK